MPVYPQSDAGYLEWKGLFVRLQWLFPFLLNTSSPCFQETHTVCFIMLRKMMLTFYSIVVVFKLYTRLRNRVSVSYIHSRNIYWVPMERAWKDMSNHVKYLNCRRFFRHKATTCDMRILTLTTLTTFLNLHQISLPTAVNTV